MKIFKFQGILMNADNICSISGIALAHEATITFNMAGGHHEHFYIPVGPDFEYGCQPRELEQREELLSATMKAIEHDLREPL